MGDGARTHDHRNHNPGLYQLSYAHHYNEQAEMVRTERLELSHLAAPEPKSGVSTNFTTSATHQAMGWAMGLEPTTTGITIRGSTN